MKSTIVLSIVLIVTEFLILTMAQAQEIHSVIPTSGGTVSGSNGSVSCSIGQIVYTTNSGTTGTVTQGVQQPYEIQIVTGIEEAKSVSLTCSAYPNPVTDLLTLKLGSYNKENLSYQLYDINGKFVINDRITNDETTIPMKNNRPSVYFLKVMNANQVIKTFKITKK